MQEYNGILDTVAWLSRAFSDGKTLFEHSLAFDNDAVHMLVGVLLQVASALLLRKSFRDFVPWIIVLILELCNEANDLLFEVWPDPSRQMGEACKDVLLTMLMPTLLLVLVRSNPHLFVRAGPQED